MAAVGASHLALVNPDPASAGPLLARRRPTLVETFPNVFLRWEQLADDPAGPLHNVRIFLSTFDAAHPRAIRTMLAASHRRFPIYAQAYAQSELGAIALSFRSQRTVESDARDVGLPALALSRVRVHDPASGRRLPPGRTGVLRVRSPGLFGGYVGQPELTARQQQGGWWDTGDMGSRSRTGRVRLAGRVVDAVDGQPDYLAWEDVLLDRLPELTELVLLDGDGGHPQPVLCTREDAPLDQERWLRDTRASRSAPAAADAVERAAHDRDVEGQAARPPRAARAPCGALTLRTGQRPASCSTSGVQACQLGPLSVVRHGARQGTVRDHQHSGERTREHDHLEDQFDHRGALLLMTATRDAPPKPGLRQQRRRRVSGPPSPHSIKLLPRGSGPMCTTTGRSRRG